MRMLSDKDNQPIGRDRFTSEVGLFYDNDSSTYDEDRWTTDAGKTNMFTQAKNIEELNRDWIDKRIIEIGVGTGRIAAQVASKGALVIGIDISEGMLKECREKMQGLGLSNVYVARADGAHLPFADSTYSGCLCINVLSHVPDFRKVLAEIARILVEGGFAIINVPNLLSVYFPFGLYVNLTKKSVLKGVYTKWYNPVSFLKVALSCGLVCRRVTGQVHIPEGIKSTIVQKSLNAADRLMRFSFLRWLCPTLFFRFEKMSTQERHRL